MCQSPRLLLWVAALASSAAFAADVPEESEGSGPRYVIGAGLHWQPESAGARRNEITLKPLWAVQWGRWRLSTGGGAGLLGFGAEVLGAGASADLIRNQTVRLGVSLRIDGGRKSDEASTTAGLPDVRRTARGRIYASYALAPDWQVAASLSQDLLGRQGGWVGGLDLGWRLQQTAYSEWTAGVGVSAANGVNMRSYFGITPAGAMASGLPVFSPSTGLRDVHAGIGYRRSLTPHWIWFGSAGVSRLVGPAADSPLTQMPTGFQVGFGLAYRN